MNRTCRIALTGGPGAGKTLVCAWLASERPDLFVHVPEAATQVYALLGTRWDKLDLEGRREAQRRIYALQLRQEQSFASGNPCKVLLLDRGTVDGAAYWPEGPDAYWRDLGTSHAAELRRYDAVVWLQSCAAIGAYDGDSSNPCRFEDPATAMDTDARLGRLWETHPQFHRVPACPTLQQKIDRVTQLLRAILPTASHVERETSL